MVTEPDPTPSADPDALVRLVGVSKSFPGVRANDEVSIDLFRGRVHCLLGENGAGKSTLISVLAGLQRPDSGAVLVAGTPVVLGSPRDSLGHGIGVVSQHSALIPSMTVLENLMLGGGGFWLDPARARRRFAELAELLGAEIDPDAVAGGLALGQQQQVEIAKALWAGPALLVLDEPTSMLPPHAVDALLACVRRLRGERIAVLFVTHKLAEALEIGDEVTVLRGGRVVDRISPRELRASDVAIVRRRILASMFGERAVADAPPGSAPARAPLSADAPVVLRVHDLTTGRAGAVTPGTPVSGICLDIRAGEILGVAGIDGHGQRHLAEAIAGQLVPESGRIELRVAAERALPTEAAEAPEPGAADSGSPTRDITRLPVKARQRLGVRYVTDDRLHEGIVGSLSVALNLVLKRIGERPFWRFGRLQRQAVQREAEARIAEYDIRTPSAQTPAGRLSGGNIQRLLLARELAHHPSVVVFHKPTVGLDLGAVAHVRDAIREFAGTGGAVLLISSDLDELVDLADRIAVLSHGRLVGEVPGKTSDPLGATGVNGDIGAADRNGRGDARSIAERVGALMVGAA